MLNKYLLSDWMNEFNTYLRLARCEALCRNRGLETTKKWNYRRRNWFCLLRNLRRFISHLDYCSGLPTVHPASALSPYIPLVNWQPERPPKSQHQIISLLCLSASNGFPLQWGHSPHPSPRPVTPEAPPLTSPSPPAPLFPSLTEFQTQGLSLHQIY